MFKIILKSINQKKLAVIFIILQIYIINFMLFGIINELNISGNQEKEVNESFGELKDNLIKIDFNDLYPSEEFMNKIISLEDYLRAEKEINLIGGVGDNGIWVEKLANNLEYIDKIKNNGYVDAIGNPIKDVGSYIIDKDLKGFIKCKIREGRFFEDSDFDLDKNDKIPIVIGSELNDFLKVGDVVEISTTDEIKGIVIGVIEKGEKVINFSNIISYNPDSLDYKILLPTYKEIKSNYLHVANKANKEYIFTRNKEDNEILKNKVLLKSKELGLSVKVNTLEDLKAEFKNSNKYSLIIIYISITLAVIFTIFSLTSVILISINKRKREIGIRLVTGTSIMKIKFLFMGEILFITIIGVLTSCIYKIYEQHRLNIMSKVPFSVIDYINSKSIAYIVVFIFSIVLVSSYIPFKRLEKLQPKDLIGGKE